MSAKYSALRIIVRSEAASSIEEVARQMQELADEIQIGVEGKFNDVRLYAIPGGDWTRIPRRFLEAYKQDDPRFRFATSGSI